MKTRDGFVSNSSSTCFIFDLREPKVKEFVELNRKKGIDSPDIGRGTAISVGYDVAEYIDELEDLRFGYELIEILYKWIYNLGADNIVFARWSDEGIGGNLTGFHLVEKLILDQVEYH